MWKQWTKYDCFFLTNMNIMVYVIAAAAVAVVLTSVTVRASCLYTALVFLLGLEQPLGAWLLLMPVGELSAPISSAGMKSYLATSRTLIRPNFNTWKAKKNISALLKPVARGPRFQESFLGLEVRLQWKLEKVPSILAFFPKIWTCLYWWTGFWHR